MPAFFIADIRIHDPEGYQGYLAGFMEIFERYQGTLRVVSSATAEVIEGDWSPNGLVVMEFPTVEQAKAWLNDPDYVELAKIRKTTAETNLVFVPGL